MKLAVEWSILFRAHATSVNFSQSRSGMNGRYSPPTDRWREGHTVQFAPDAAIEDFSTIGYGDSLYSIGSFSSVTSPLRVGTTVGRYVAVAPGGALTRFRHPVEAVTISSATFSFGRENIAPYFAQYERTYGSLNKTRVPTPQPQDAPNSIGNDVWIGADVTLSGGLRIGDGAIVAGGSVVTKDVEPYSVVAGAPAVHRKWRFPEAIRSELLESHWWDLELGDMYAKQLDFSDPRNFLTRLRELQGDLRTYSPKVWRPIRTLASSLFPAGEVDDLVITSHSTLMGIDPASGRLVATKDGGALIPLRVRGRDLWADGQRIGGISEDGTVQFDDMTEAPRVISRGPSFFLKVGPHFLTATPSGGVGLVAEPRAWEEFTSVSAALGGVS